MEFILAGAAVVIIAFLLWRLNTVVDERDGAYAALADLRDEHVKQCYLSKQGAEMQEQAIRNAESWLAAHGWDDPEENDNVT